MSTQSQTTDSLSPLQSILQDQALHAQTIARLEAAGAILLRPESSVFSPQVQIAAGAVIEPGVQLLGATRIGAGSLVRSGCILENAVVGERMNGRQFAPCVHPLLAGQETPAERKTYSPPLLRTQSVVRLFFFNTHRRVRN